RALTRRREPRRPAPYGARLRRLGERAEAAARRAPGTACGGRPCAAADRRPECRPRVESSAIRRIRTRRGAMTMRISDRFAGSRRRIHLLAAAAVAIGFAGGAAAQPSTAQPAPVPDAVAIPRPSPEEVEIARRSL